MLQLWWQGLSDSPTPVCSVYPVFTTGLHFSLSSGKGPIIMSFSFIIVVEFFFFNIWNICLWDLPLKVLMKDMSLMAAKEKKDFLLQKEKKLLMGIHVWFKLVAFDSSCQDLWSKCPKKEEQIRVHLGSSSAASLENDGGSHSLESLFPLTLWAWCSTFHLFSWLQPRSKPELPLLVQPWSWNPVSKPSLLAVSCIAN